MNRTLALALSVALSLTTLASSAFGDPPASEPGSEERLPVAKAERPLTLPRLVLDPTADFDITRLQANDSFVNLGLAAAFGITDDVGVRALVLPLQLSGPAGNGFNYGQTSEDRGPSVGATFRFVRAAAELGLSLDVRLLTAQSLSGVAILPGVPLRIHIGKKARLDAAVQLNITWATSTTPAPTAMLTAPKNTSPGIIISSPSTSANAVRLQVPVSALYNIVESFHVGVTTGLTIYDLNNTRNTMGIPVGILAGYAVPGTHGPILDIDPFFTFPYLIMPERTSVTNTGEFVAGVNIAGFIYL